MEYQWSFGDGKSSSEVNPVHNYEEPGKYTVTLTADHLADCHDMKVQGNVVEVGEAYRG